MRNFLPLKVKKLRKRQLNLFMELKNKTKKNIIATHPLWKLKKALLNLKWKLFLKIRDKGKVLGGNSLKKEETLQKSDKKTQLKVCNENINYKYKNLNLVESWGTSGVVGGGTGTSYLLQGGIKKAQLGFTEESFHDYI